MPRRTEWGILFSALPALACGSEPPPVDPPGTFAFAVLGDAPYSGFDEQRFDHVIEELEADDLAWVIHVGDILDAPCSDEAYRDRLQLFDRLAHPVVYTPGDNEWTDCWGRAQGGHRPLERLERLRGLFFDEPDRALGRERLDLESQADDPEWGQFVENRRWTRDGIVFATVHLVGSGNALYPFPGRTVDSDAEARRRTEAATAWLESTFEHAREIGADAVFLATHADLVFEASPDNTYRQLFEPFRSTLLERVEGFDGTVILAHGDSHDYIVDRPFLHPPAGPALDNFTRLQVMGSPAIGWVRVVVDTAGPSFSFTPRRIPWWKLW